MFREKTKVKGMVTFTVFDSNGKIKEYKRGLLRRALNLPARKMIHRHHNTITNMGDGLIADWMMGTPTQNKVDATNGYMIVGTGWTGSTPKANTSVNTPIGTYVKLDSGFPKKAASFGSTGHNVLQYRTSFLAGTLNANGINEVALMNGNTAGASCLAYAQITLSVNVTASDTLQIDWEITFNSN